MDDVLRKNLTVKIYNSSQPANSPSRQFRQAADGSPHIFLLDHIHELEARLSKRILPRLLNIEPEHKFGFFAREL